MTAPCGVIRAAEFTEGCSASTQLARIVPSTRAAITSALGMKAALMASGTRLARLRQMGMG